MSAVFSEYELKEMGIKSAGSAEYKSANCVGSCEEELDTRIISKKCRGITVKKVVRGAGTGKLKLSLHMPYDIYTDVYGMDIDTLVEGVKGYGTNSIHKEFATTQHVFDEDGNEKFKAYPKCVIETGVARKIENGGEEVAEIELEASLMPDEYGQCIYEALAADLKDETLKTTWMTAFTPELVQAEKA
jgi:hypothetical protein